MYLQIYYKYSFVKNMNLNKFFNDIGITYKELVVIIT